MRHVALAKLAAADETYAVQVRFVDHLLRLAETAERATWGRDAASWLDRLEREHDNFRAALAWLIETQRIEQAHVLAAHARAALARARSPDGGPLLAGNHRSGS